MENVVEDQLREIQHTKATLQNELKRCKWWKVWKFRQRLMLRREIDGLTVLELGLVRDGNINRQW